MNLYEIEKKQLDLLQKAEEFFNSDSLDASLINEIDKELEINKEDLKDKALSYVKYISNLQGDINNIDSEIKRLQSLKKGKTNIQDKLKNNLEKSLNTFEISKLDLGIFKLSFRKSTSVNCEDFSTHWQDKADNFLDVFKQTILNESNEFSNELEIVKDLFEIEIKIKPNKALLKEKLVEGKNNFLSSLIISNNLQIK
jgi:hypothetical protein